MSKQGLSVLNDDGVLLCGYYKKLKTMRKKFFVLYNDTPCKAARIEYYDNEKKYKSGFTPKRIIKINNCFNINRRLYTKHEFVIVLASKEGGFGIVLDSEDEMNTWLSHLLHLQRSGETCFDFPKFECVWQVIIQKKGIAEQHNVFGSHHICLTNRSVIFVKIGREKMLAEKRTTKVDVLLTTIRRCGDSHCFFYMEVGRQCSLGPGELWMETEDALTAKNMHEMILSKMVLLNEALTEPMRKRSSSATETTNLRHDRKSSQNVDVANNYLIGAQNVSRDRCDSLPSRNRTSSELSNRMTTISSNIAASRATNYNVINASPVAFSASEESISVEDCEESIGMSYLISSRSPKGVIPEEYVNDVSQFQNIKENTDIKPVATSFTGPGIKANLPFVKNYNATKGSDTIKDICGNIDNQLLNSTQNYAFESKCGNDVVKETTSNRVRAFSVGSRIRSTRLSSKASPKLFNSDSVDCSTRKSVSVPVLINKNLHSIDQTSDLMEMDFSKSIGKTLGRSCHHKNECQNASYMQPRTLAFSNSEESVQRSIKKSDNGYLEMKPITLDANSVAFNRNNPTNYTATANSQNQNNLIQKDHKMDSASSSEIINDTETISSQKDINYLNLNNKTDKYSSSKSITSDSFSDSIYSSTCSKKDNDDIKTDQLEEAGINKDLYYASLDLPKCENEVNNRYGCEESLSDLNTEEIKNEYAKINFVQPDTSQSLTKKQY